jgi:2-polyprenyl-3-methyl-5-hydroxy-6-metoxy-1,4-benzoquinol methylase
MIIEKADRRFHSGKTPGLFQLEIHVGDKYEIIRKFVSGKNILDVGCTGGDPEAYSNELWAHGYIKRHAKSVKGLDLNKNEVERLNGLGYDITYGNAENFNLNRTFDVIFSGDLIEHLYNPGLFLKSARLHMGQESRLILVTPNPYRIGRIKGMVLNGYVRSHADHTCWFDPVTLSQLLDFHGFRAKNIYWTGYSKRMIKYLGVSVLDKLSFKGIFAEDFIIVAKMSC